MAIDKILHKINLFNSLDDDKFQHICQMATLETIEKNTLIIAEGGLADALYVIEEGSVQVFTTNQAGKEVVLARLNEESYFGEQGYFNNSIRTASVRALTSVNLIKINYSALDTIYQYSDAVRQYLARTSIERITKNLETQLQHINQIVSFNTNYKLPNHSAVVNQFNGNFQGMEVIFMKYNLADGKIILCTKIANQPMFIMKQMDVKPDLILKFNRGTLIERIVSFKNNALVSIISIGAWDEVNILCEMLLDNIAIYGMTQESFAKNGNLLSLSSNSAHYDSDLICNCMGVSYKEIRDCINAGNRQFEKICNVTGACQACGSCRTKILDILGTNAWRFATIQLAEKYTNDISSFIIKPLYNKLLPFTAGQYITIKIQIDNLWIERTYSLVSIPEEEDHYTIVVKKRGDGALSPWLYEHSHSPLFIWVSAPKGDFVLEKASEKTVLCFAGGVGMAPFIGFIRENIHRDAKTKLKIYYAFSNKKDFFIPDDVLMDLDKNENIQLERWDTSLRGYISAEDIQQEMNQYHPEAIYICGPKEFEHTITDELDKINFDKTKIFVERFLPSA